MHAFNDMEREGSYCTLIVRATLCSKFVHSLHFDLPEKIIMFRKRDAIKLPSTLKQYIERMPMTNELQKIVIICTMKPSIKCLSRTKYRYKSITSNPKPLRMNDYRNNSLKSGV